MFNKLWLLWEAALVSTGFYGQPKIVTYGPLPQKIAVYDRIITTADYWNGPLTLDPEDLSYVRGSRRFHNPSNLGLNALPNVPEIWANRRLHLDKDCNQPGPLTAQQQLALNLIMQRSEPLPNGAVTWRYDYELNFGNLVFQPGFNSAFSQAVNTAALLFGECKTVNRVYFDLAKKAALTLITPIEAGGVMNTENGLTFFEELPAPKGLSPYILNAHILSVNVLFAMAARTNDERFKDYAERGIETLIKLAPQYTATKCIKYALKQPQDNCHPDYDAYEAVLLDDLYQWSGDKRIGALSDEWKNRAAGPYPPKLKY